MVRWISLRNKTQKREKKNNIYIYLVVGSFNHVPHGEVILACGLELAIG